MTAETSASHDTDDGVLANTLSNAQPIDVYMNTGPQQEADNSNLWDPSILARTNWLGSIDLDAFDPTLPDYGSTFVLPQPGEPCSSPPSLFTRASPSQTETTVTTRQDHQTEVGEYYVDGQPARQSRGKRRKPSKATSTVHNFQVYRSLQEPKLITEDIPSSPFEIRSDSYEKICYLHQHLCLATTPLYKSFDNESFPSKAFLERLIAATTTSIAPTLPFLHHSYMFEGQLHWLEIIALASLACHFADMERKHDFTISMHDFVRRIIHWIDEQHQPVDEVDNFVLAKILSIHAIGATYCGDDRLCKHALDLTSRLAGSFRKSLRTRLEQVESSRGSADWTFTMWRHQQSLVRLLHFILLQECMTAYHFQRKASLAQEDLSIPLPCQEKVWSVRNEDEWLSVKAHSPGILSPPPTLAEAMQQLYVDKWLPRERGEFARILMIHALFHRTWEVESYYKNPLSHWEPVAQRQESAEILPSRPIWLPSIPAFTRWQNSACDALDILHWQANATIGLSSGLEHPTVLHLHMARIVLLAPHLEIVSHVQSLTGLSIFDPEDETHSLRSAYRSSSAALLIRRWAIGHQYKARLAAIHAGVAFWHVRRYSTDAYYEAPSIALAALTLWAFGTFARKQPPRASQGAAPSLPVGEGSHRPTSVNDDNNDDDAESCAIILLDRPTDDELVQQFIKNGDRMEAHMSGIGDLYAPQSPRLVLKQARKLLRQNEKCWGIASKWLRLLERLSECST